jgi:hypothetical protein
VSFRGFWGIICSDITNSSENNNRRIPPPPRPPPFFLFTAEEHLAASPDYVTAWISCAQMVKRPLEDEAVVARLQPGVSAPSDVCVSRESIFRARRAAAPRHRRRTTPAAAAAASGSSSSSSGGTSRSSSRLRLPRRPAPPLHLHRRRSRRNTCSGSRSSCSGRQRRGLSLSGEFGAPQTRDNHGKLMQALGLLELDARERDVR